MNGLNFYFLLSLAQNMSSNLRANEICPIGGSTLGQEEPHLVFTSCKKRESFKTLKQSMEEIKETFIIHLDQATKLVDEINKFLHSDKHMWTQPETTSRFFCGKFHQVFLAVFFYHFCWIYNLQTTTLQRRVLQIPLYQIMSQKHTKY